MNALPAHMRLVKTQDGSPSIEIHYENTAELMHHSHGAFTESIYIYAHALQRAPQSQEPLRILSIGLGLAYNEIISSAWGCANKRELQILSFESESFLRTQFVDWVLRREPNTLAECYDDILDRSARHFEVERQDVLDSLQSQMRAKNLTLETTFDLTKLPETLFEVVYFDPFSKKASPEFWSPEFLQEFIEKSCDESCVFSTYAATGDLKRALREAGFEVDLRPGFAGKKHSIFATRNLPKV